MSKSDKAMRDLLNTVAELSQTVQELQEQHEHTLQMHQHRIHALETELNRVSRDVSMHVHRDSEGGMTTKPGIYGYKWYDLVPTNFVTVRRRSDKEESDE